MTTSSSKNQHVGLWTLVYNVGLFILACGILIVIKRYPTYKVGLVLVVVGILLVNINSILRFYWYDQQLKAMENQQNANIVLSHCPDFWVKNATANSTLCQNLFVRPESGDTITFGGSGAVQEYDLAQLDTMSNQDKCWQFTSSPNPVPWVDLQNRCKDANV